MLRTRAVEVSLWEAVLPDEVLRLPDELARVDALLDDPAFFAPFVPFFDPRLGQPSTPMEVYLRLMFLKFRHRLGYESLCREVANSITWRRFCRIPLDGRVPHPTTLMKLTTRCGTAAVDGCNEALLAKAAQGEAAAHHAAARGHHRGPRGRGLPDRLRAAGQGGAMHRRGWPADPGRGRSHPHSAAGSRPFRRSRAREIGSKLRLRGAQARDEAQATVRRVTGELAGLAEKAAGEAEKLLINARRALRRARAKAAELAAVGGHDALAGRRRGRLRRAVNDLADLLAVTRRIAAQTRQRLSERTAFFRAK
jgi:transposase, IS5 family